MDIAAVLSESAEHFADPPPNESNTCEWVILPILYGLGYGKKEVVSRDADNAGKFPDYTLLPGVPERTFYLEAKAWKVDLEDGHVNQALNYANQNGRRWVVLTNGRIWRLYDNTICSAAKGKLVAEADLHVTSATRFLTAISRPSVVEGGLPKFAQEERERLTAAARNEMLRRVLESEVCDSASRLVNAMCQHIRSRDGLEWVSADDIVACFSEAEPPVVPGDSACAPASHQTDGDEVLVIPARDAWDFYCRYSVYPCQPNRTFRRTSHLAFYASGRIEVAVPRILDVVEAVDLSERGIQSCTTIGEPARKRLMELLRLLDQRGDTGAVDGLHKVVFLSSPDSPETIRLPQPVVNDYVDKKGAVTAFVQNQRYVSLAKLRSGPKKTSELVEG